MVNKYDKGWFLSNIYYTKPIKDYPILDLPTFTKITDGRMEVSQNLKPYTKITVLKSGTGHY